MSAPSPDRQPRWPRRVVATTVLAFAVYFAAGVFALLATEPAADYTGRNDPVGILLAATFGRSSAFMITSVPLAWATRICWAAAVALLVVAVVLQYRFLRRLSPAELRARLVQRPRRRR